MWVYSMNRFYYMYQVMNNYFESVHNQCGNNIANNQNTNQNWIKYSESSAPDSSKVLERNFEHNNT